MCKKIIAPIISIMFFASCSQDESTSFGFPNDSSTPKTEVKTSIVDAYFNKHEHQNESNSIGSVSNGKLENGVLIPYYGENYQYFDKTSYLSGRAFSHKSVATTILDTYEQLLKNGIDRYFRVMECSHQHGGKIFPHRTHQNGLSVDFMTPLMKNSKPYYKLDSLGASHYLLEFNNNGEYVKDTSVRIDFDMVALHILTLNKTAQEQGLSISKVIFKTELKEELYSSKYGAELKNSGIYITKNLQPIINELHDDHYHVDFKIQ
jgi:penicillin-insensitive murein endopeptidase